MSTQQIQSVEILQMSSQELELFVQDFSQENPFVDIEENKENNPVQNRENDLLGKMRWLEESDYQNLYYHTVSEEEMNPLLTVGSSGGFDDTLVNFVKVQLERMKLEDSKAKTVVFLAECLDDNGYFRENLSEISKQVGLPEERTKESIQILRSLEPAGIAAVNLSDCLEIQLKRFGSNDLVLEIVRNHLESLAHRHYRHIALQLNVAVENVRAAAKVIEELEPRPGAIFQHESEISYITPDAYIEQEGETLSVRMAERTGTLFKINAYYKKLLKTSDDKEVHEYLMKKLSQAESIMQAIYQRGTTLKRCCEAVVNEQHDFFIHGPQALTPLRMTDIAEQLELHESTISRAIRNKYLQCKKGIFPLSYFFVQSTTAWNCGDIAGEETLGNTAVKELLKQIVEKENRTHPFSDQELCRMLAGYGCSVSRRTVAKYRGELNIPSSFARKIV